MSTEFSINDEGKSMFTVFELLTVLIDTTSVLNRKIDPKAKPIPIKINITTVLVDIVLVDGFFDVKTVFLLVFFDLLPLTFAKSFICLHFLHWSYS